MKVYNIVTVGADRATLGSDLSVSTVEYNRGWCSCDAVLLHTRYRQKCDKSFFFYLVRLFHSYQRIDSLYGRGKMKSVFDTRSG